MIGNSFNAMIGNSLEGQYFVEITYEVDVKVFNFSNYGWIIDSYSGDSFLHPFVYTQILPINLSLS
jgi:hypothetical protein